MYLLKGYYVIPIDKQQLKHQSMRSVNDWQPGPNVPGLVIRTGRFFKTLQGGLCRGHAFLLPPLPMYPKVQGSNS